MLRSRVGLAFATFAIVSLAATFLLSKMTPIVWEEHFRIGQNLRSTGALVIDRAPSLFRPPGYPVFVTSSLWIADQLFATENLPDAEREQRDRHDVVIAQALLLGVLAAAVFWTASVWSSSSLAAVLALLATLNPYTFSLVGVLSYHLLFVVTSTLSTSYMLTLRRRQSSQALLTTVGGVMWGIVSLVKPVTLVMPLFFGLVFAFGNIRSALVSVLLFVLGMSLVVAPYVARNYRITGQPIVTAQPGFGFWGTSVERMRPDQKFLVWQPIWWEHGMPIFSRVTGSTEYSQAILNKHAVALNAAFTQAALQNIQQNPSIYLYNVARNFISFNLDTMRYWPQNALPGSKSPKSFGRIASDLWIVPFLFASLTGIIWSLAKRDEDSWIVIAAYLGMVLAHSISFSTELYTYARMPMFILGFMLLTKRLVSLEGDDQRRVGSNLAQGVTWAMAAWGIAATGAAVIW